MKDRNTLVICEVKTKSSADFGLPQEEVDFFKKKDGMMMLFNTWLIPILAIFVCVYIFKSEMRYRVPYDIWFIPVGVKGWGSLFRR